MYGKGLNQTRLDFKGPTHGVHDEFHNMKWFPLVVILKNSIQRSRNCVIIRYQIWRHLYETTNIRKWGIYRKFINVRNGINSK